MWEEWYTEKVLPVFAPSMIILNSMEIIIYYYETFKDLVRHRKVSNHMHHGLTWTLIITG